MTLGKQFDEHVERLKGLMAMETPEFKDAAKATAFANLDVSKGTHGTISTDGSVPDEIIPSAKFGRSVWALSDPNRTYYNAPFKTGPSMHEHLGWRWADGAARYYVSGNQNEPAPRKVLLHVEPQGEIDIDRGANPDGTANYMTADSLKVTGADWIPVPDKYDEDVIGIQGTLPGVNWNAYEENLGRKGDTNYKILRKED